MSNVKCKINAFTWQFRTILFVFGHDDSLHPLKFTDQRLSLHLAQFLFLQIGK
jgi:hypothetical protein